jgi:hypothetical protein
MTAKEPVAAWVVDDTGFVKKGTHSVGVARQYCGQVSKQENCRVAVSLSVATQRARGPSRKGLLGNSCVENKGFMVQETAKNLVSGRVSRQRGRRPDPQEEKQA